MEFEDNAMELAIFVFSGIIAGATVWLGVLHWTGVRETSKLNKLLLRSEQKSSELT